MAKVLKFLLGWVIAAVATTAMATALQTQNVIARLDSIDADIGIGPRLSMTLYDLMHFGSVYIIFIGLGTLVAYLFGLIVYRFVGFGRPIVFAVAGAVAMFVMLMLMKHAFFGIQMVAGARSGFGIALQMMAGAVGGLIFEHLTAGKADGFQAAS